MARVARVFRRGITRRMRLPQVSVTGVIEYYLGELSRFKKVRNTGSPVDGYEFVKSVPGSRGTS